MSVACKAHGVSAVLVIVLLSAACSSTGGSDGDVPRSDAESACRDALRDLRTWCAETIGATSSPGSRFNCLDARLRFDQNCYPG